MRVFTAELKRLLKTRSILILMLAALLLAPVLAYFPASFTSWTYKDDSGQKSGGRKGGSEAGSEESGTVSRSDHRGDPGCSSYKVHGSLPQDTRAVYRTAFMMKGWRPAITMKRWLT